MNSKGDPRLTLPDGGVPFRAESTSVEFPIATGRGTAFLEVGAHKGISAVTSLRSANPLRLLAPMARGSSVWAYTSSFGGGLLGGDETQLDLRLDDGARCFVGSQSAAKLYRNPDNLPCSHTTRAKVGPEALLVYMPDPVQPFAESRFRQRQEFQLADGAGLVLLDAVVSGRWARGERWAGARLESRNEVWTGGNLRFLDVLLLRPADGELDGPFRLGRFNYLALLLLWGPLVATLGRAILERVDALPVPNRGTLAVSGSPLIGGVVVRVAAERTEEGQHWVREQLSGVAALLGDDPWARKW